MRIVRVARLSPLAGIPLQRRVGVFVIGMIFAVGFAVGAGLRPTLVPHVNTAFATWRSAPPPAHSMAQQALVQLSQKSVPPSSYPAEVVRIIDGDTFAARVHVWPGVEINTKVRLRNIDAPELHARCARELAKAQAARAALEGLLAAGNVTLSQIGLDKYAGRIDAIVATRDVADVSAALLNGGFARSYDGGRRGSWCRA